MQKLEPIKLAMKYHPPKLALVYAREDQQFIHEFPLEPNDLVEPSESILEILDTFHPGYLNFVDQGQVLELIEKVKLKHQGSAENVREFNKYIDEVELYSDDDSNSDEGIDYDAIDNEIAGSSDDEMF